jgi:hypothetical protein
MKSVTLNFGPMVLEMVSKYLGYVGILDLSFLRTIQIKLKVSEC